MPRQCTVCTHEAKLAIEADIIGGASLRTIAKQYGLKPDAVFRHKKHVSVNFRKAAELVQIAEGLSTLESTNGLCETAITILKEALEKKDNDLALKAMDRAVKTLELRGKLKGEMTPQKATAQSQAIHLHLSDGETRSMLMHRRRPTEDERKQLGIGTTAEAPPVTGKVQ